MSLEKKTIDLSIAPTAKTPAPTLDTKSLFDQISEKIKNEKNKPKEDKQLEKTLTDIQSKLPQKRGAQFPPVQIQDVEIIVPTSSPTPPIITSEAEITATKIRCRQCKKEKAVTEFKSEASGKLIKTCNVCQGKNVIKNPRFTTTTSTPKSQLSKVLDKADELEAAETFDREFVIKRIKESKYPHPEHLDTMTDEELKQIRREIFVAAVKKFKNAESFLFEVSLGTIGFLEGVLPNDEFDIRGLKEDVEKDRDQWLEVIKDMIEESPEFMDYLTPKKRALILIANSIMKTTQSNKKKKFGSTKDGGKP